MGSDWGPSSGLLSGFFFLPFGLILGPLIGAYAFEALFAKQGLRRAAVSGFGSAVGTLSSLVVKVFVALLMIVWFFMDVFLID